MRCEAKISAGRRRAEPSSSHQCMIHAQMHGPNGHQSPMVKFRTHIRVPLIYGQYPFLAFLAVQYSVRPVQPPTREPRVPTFHGA